VARWAANGSDRCCKTTPCFCLAMAAAIVILANGATPVLAQQPTTVQPLQGQSPDLVQQDMAACQSAATQSSGHNPTQPPVAAAPAGPSGQRLRGAAAGAVAGGVRAGARGNQYEAWDEVDDDRKQDYRRDEAQSAARAGAAVGGVRARQDRREARRQQGQQQQQQASAADAWSQAYEGCLQGRGYSVTP
jgi:hypothetical protein